MCLLLRISLVCVVANFSHTIATQLNFIRTCDNKKNVTKVRAVLFSRSELPLSQLFERL